MNILLITQYFPPEIGAAASRWGDYVNLLIKKGHKVTVLCEMPNYPYGKLFKGYKTRLYKEEKVSENLSVIRSGVWVNNRLTSFKIIGNYLSFAIIGMINVLKIKKHDIIIISSPPLFVGLISIIFKKIKSSIILLDLRDIWPESVIALDGIKSKLLIKMGKWLETKVYNSVNGFIFTVPGFYNYFKEFFPEQLNKPMFNLMNGIDRQFLENTKDNIINNGQFNVLYSGNIGKAQGLEIVIKTAKMLIDYPINFCFIGDGVQKKSLINLAKLNGLNNILFRDPLSRNELIKEIKSATLCLVPLKNNELFKTALPSKMFEIMACGKPLILGLKGDAAKIVKENNCGLVVEPENLEELKDAILKYYNDSDLVIKHGENGVTYITNNMQKESLLSEFIIELRNKREQLSLNINI